MRETIEEARALVAVGRARRRMASRRSLLERAARGRVSSRRSRSRPSTHTSSPTPPGTTGRPKGALHVQGGFLLSIAREAAYQSDIRAGDRVLFATDMGWIMGPWTVVGAGALGAAVVYMEGAPDWPDDRLWRLVEAERVTMLGVSPTLVRALIPKGEPDDRPLVAARDHDDRRALERRPVRLAERARRRRRARSRSSTSPAAPRSAPASSPVTPMAPTKPCSLGFPALGQAMDVYSPDGAPLRGEVGELVCTRAWPGMTRGIWGDDERYLETYWRRFPGVWTHGDWASIDEDGYWFLHGRSDDTLNIAGKRIGPAELESAALDHPSVAEAAAIGVPHEVKGEVGLALLRAQARGRGGSGRGHGRGRGGARQGLRPGARSLRAARCRRRAARRSCAAPCARRRSARIPATSRRSRIPRPWRRSRMPSRAARHRRRPRDRRRHRARAGADGWHVDGHRPHAGAGRGGRAEIGGTAVAGDVSSARTSSGWSRVARADRPARRERGRRAVGGSVGDRPRRVVARLRGERPRRVSHVPAALPGMIERGGGRIVITGSGASYLPGLTSARVLGEQGGGRPLRRGARRSRSSRTGSRCS